jgi:hypothetical protein
MGVVCEQSSVDEWSSCGVGVHSCVSLCVDVDVDVGMWVGVGVMFI